MRVTGLDHVSLTCADLDRSLAFYRDALGLPVRDRGSLGGPELAALLDVEEVAADFADVDLGEGRTLELVSGLTAGCAGGHLSLRTDDVDGLVARLQAAGHPIVSRAPVTLTEPGFWHGARVVYVRDPDGALVELIQWPGGV